MAARGDFGIALHTHLPFVLNHGRWPHGSDWLAEVAIQCYVPLLRALERLHADRLPVRLTLDVSPVLCEQLASPQFMPEVEAYLQARFDTCAANRGEFAAQGRDDLVAPTRFWEAFYRGVLRDLDAMEGDLLGALRRLQDAGVVELATCAATHGYLPLLLRDESVALQVRVGRAAHRRAFGRDPAGIWLPECAYRPRYEWTPPLGSRSGRVRYRRRGLEEILALEGLRFFYTDVHMLRGGQAPSPYRDVYPVLQGIADVDGVAPARRARTPYRAYRVASRGGRGDAAALVRDPETTMQVWSRDQGYPGDGWYLEFHRQHAPGGNRYWRVTSPATDLGAKAVYEPDRAAWRAAAHAGHFVELVGTVLDRARGEAGEAAIVCAPFDTELFGHWWFEGPQWLERVLRGLPSAGIAAVSASDYLEAHPPQETITLLEGSWGEGGDHRVWLNRDTESMWEKVYTAEEGFWAAVRSVRWESDALVGRALAQAARELLLLQASDWPFLITSRVARTYAETRFAEHYADVTRLLELVQRVAAGEAPSSADEAHLEASEERDAVFPDIAEHLLAAREVRA